MNRAVTGEISTCEQPTAHTDQPMLLLTKTMERPWSDEMMLSCVAGRRHCPWCQRSLLFAQQRNEITAAREQWYLRPAPCAQGRWHVRKACVMKSSLHARAM